MDNMLARINRIYPNSDYVEIQAYNPDQWVDREYDSRFDTKKPINNWSRKPLTYEQAQDVVERGGRIGWVVPKGLVVIDIDNADDPKAQQYVEELLKKFEVKYSYNYTSRGIHILFMDPTCDTKTDAHMKCGLNIMIDTRANGGGYIILPCNDPHRQWGTWSDYVEELPYFLKPIVKDNTPSFIGMTDGDGRNDALFRWRNKLDKSKKLSPQQVEKCIRIINENLFAQPMTNSELFKTVLRDLGGKEGSDNSEKANIYNELADELLGKVDIICYYDQFFKFNGICYQKLELLDLERIIHTELSPNITQAGRKEIMAFLKIKTLKSKDEFDVQWNKIACKNGVINLVTGELEPVNKTDINTVYIPYRYNTDPVYSPRIDEFFKQISGGDIMKMEFLYQVVGYCLLKNAMFHKFFIMVGEGGTGKSTYTNLIEKLVGPANASHVGLADFDKDYYLSSIMGKLVNIDDDVEGKALAYTGRFKSVVSGEFITVRQIYEEPMTYKPFATLIFNCNKLPTIMDRTSGLYRRIVIVELNNKVLNPDRQFIDKINDTDMEYLLYKAVQGIKKVLEEGHFRIDQSEEKMINMFKRRQSALNEWLYENSICMKDLHMATVQSLYSQFVAWCQVSGHTKIMTKMSFAEEVRTIFDMEVRLERNEKGMRQYFYKDGNFDPEYRPF